MAGVDLFQTGRILISFTMPVETVPDTYLWWSRLNSGKASLTPPSFYDACLSWLSWSIAIRSLYRSSLPVTVACRDAFSHTIAIAFSVIFIVKLPMYESRAYLTGLYCNLPQSHHRTLHYSQYLHRSLIRHRKIKA